MKKNSKLLISILSIGLLTSLNIETTAKDVYSVSKDTNNIHIQEDYINRSEFAKLLVTTLFGDDLSDLDVENKFIDIESDDYFFKYILKAYQEELIAGVSENRFAPQEQLTREQMTVMIMRVHNKLTNTDYTELFTTAEIRFEDEEQISPWAKQAVLIADAMNIVNESHGDSFMPKGKVTKSEALDVANKVLDII